VIPMLRVEKRRTSRFPLRSEKGPHLPPWENELEMHRERRLPGTLGNHRSLKRPTRILRRGDDARGTGR
jgi:hypothetical protein